MDDVKKLATSRSADLKEFRRDLHRIPETAFKEVKTSAYIADYLSGQGLAVRTGVAQTGVVGELRFERPGPTLLIRADMDALPVAEATGLPFASEHANCMHACGHDAHMAMVLGAVGAFQELADQLTGAIKFVFQPAEEWPGGAKPMIEAGVMENPRVDYTLGCHVWPAIPKGTIGVKAGPMMAAMDHFNITIKGRGGHGAMPHLCVDALDAATQVVAALQRLVSRKLDPFQPSVLSFGTFHAGDAFNIIPNQAELSGTTRAFDEALWLSWRECIEQVIEGVCRSMGTTYELDFKQGYPPTVNDPYMAGVVADCAKKTLGDDKVVVPQPSMAGEDMSYFLKAAPGAYFFLGVGHDGGLPLHNPGFTFPEEVLASGLEVFARVGLRLLSGEK